MPDCIARNVHRGKRRVTKFRKLDVVEAGDRNILGDAYAALAQFAQRAHGHDVVHADDGRRLLARCQQRARGQTSAIQRVGIGGGAHFQARDSAPPRPAPA